MQTVTNVFITNLALSDILVCINLLHFISSNLIIMFSFLFDLFLQMCCLAVPFTPISAYGHTWYLGRILCHLVPMSLGISGLTKKPFVFILNLKNIEFFYFVLVYVSTLTSLAIAVDRYFVIVHPFRSRMRLGVCILLIIVIWIVGISISLPLAIYMRFDRAKCEVRRRRRIESNEHVFPLEFSL